MQKKVIEKPKVIIKNDNTSSESIMNKPANPTNRSSSSQEQRMLDSIASANEVKSGAFGVSRGIFNSIHQQTDRIGSARNSLTSQDQVISANNMGNSSMDLPPIVQEMIKNEIKNQMMLYKTEVTKFVNDTTRMNHEEVMKTKALADSLSENVRKYDDLLINLPLKFQDLTTNYTTLESEIHIAKQDIKTLELAYQNMPSRGDSSDSKYKDEILTTHNNLDTKIKNLENQQKDLLILVNKTKENLNKNANLALNDIAEKILMDNEHKLNEKLNDIESILDNKMRYMDEFVNKIKMDNEMIKDKKTESLDTIMNEKSSKYIDEKLKEIKNLIDDKYTSLKELIIDAKSSEKNPSLLNREYEVLLNNLQKEVDNQAKELNTLGSNISNLYFTMDHNFQGFQSHISKEFQRLDSLLQIPDTHLQTNPIYLSLDSRLITLEKALQAMNENQRNFGKDLTIAIKEIEDLKSLVSKLTQQAISYPNTTTTTTASILTPISSSNLGLSSSTGFTTPESIDQMGKTPIQGFTMAYGNELPKQYEVYTQKGYINTAIPEVLKYSYVNNAQHMEMVGAPSGSSSGGDYPTPKLIETSLKSNNTLSSEFTRKPELNISTSYLPARDLTKTSYDNIPIGIINPPPPLLQQLEKQPNDMVLTNDTPVDYYATKKPRNTKNIPTPEISLDSRQQKDTRVYSNTGMENMIKANENLIIGSPKSYTAKQQQQAKEAYDSGKAFGAKAGNTLSEHMVLKGTDRPLSSSDTKGGAGVGIGGTGEVGTDHSRKESTTEGDEIVELSVVYQLDTDGYLMDEEGNYIVDDNGRKVKLSEEEFDHLKTSNVFLEHN